MPFNGNGVFNLVFNWQTDAANQVNISSLRMMTQEQDIANGLSNCVTRDGQGLPTANLPMNGFKITGAADGVSAGDYVTYRQMTSTNSSSLLGFTQQGTGAAPRTVAQKLYETISAADYFQIGDLDFTNAIQRAINYLANGTGGTVLLPRGAVTISQPVRRTSD